MTNLTSRKATAVIGLGLALLASACQTRPAIDSEQRELRVVSSGGFSAAYDLLAPKFAQSHDISIHTERGASSGGAADSIPERLARGEQFDLIILSRSSLDALTKLGFVRATSRKDLVRSSIGMAVREGAPAPDISSAEGFVEVLLGAESIGYSASASGTYLSTDLFPRLGLWEKLEPKSRRILSERVAAVVARGDVEIGFQQVSEILPIEGSTFAGPIPDEYQKITTFSTGITTNAENAVDAQTIIDYFSSPEVAAVIESVGLAAVVLE